MAKSEISNQAGANFCRVGSQKQRNRSSVPSASPRTAPLPHLRRVVAAATERS
jgi:hypothetical protein